MEVYYVHFRCDLMHALRTHLRAEAAAGAEALCMPKLRLRLQPLGIVAPLAMEWAALQKDRCTDAGTVVYGITLHVEHTTPGFHSAEAPSRRDMISS